MSNVKTRSLRLRRAKRAGVGCAVLCLLALTWNFLFISKKLEELSLDFRYSRFNRATPSSDQVVVVDIDEQTFKVLGPHYGRWPWPRRIYKEVIEFLSTGEPAGIFFDLLFLERQLGSPDDEWLARVSRDTGRVSHAALFLKDPAVTLPTGTAQAPLPEEFKRKFSIPIAWRSNARPKSITYRDFNLPAPVFLENTPKVHLVTTDPDADGVFRRMPIFLKYGDDWFPSLTLEALLSTFDPDASSPIRIEADQKELLIEGKHGGETRELHVPLDSQGTFSLHYYRHSQQPASYSLSEVIDSAVKFQSGRITDPSQLAVNPLKLQGKVIVIGGSAALLEDLKRTPVEGSQAGVYLHATAISNILKQDFLQTVPASIRLFVCFALLILIYGFVFFSWNIYLKLAVPPAILLLYLGFAFLTFKQWSLSLEIPRPLIFGTLAIFDGIGYMIFVESRDKRKLKETLSKYLSPTMTDRIIATGMDPRAEVGQRVCLSVMFSDIRNFTTLSEKMPPEALVSVLNRYLGRMTDIVFETQGTLDKFLGDSIMAFWGAPVADANHAAHAIRCALKMSLVLEELNLTWAKESLPKLNAGIGINTGEVIVGNIGNDKRLDYTVIGDNVNLASRLEGLTKQYDVPIIVGAETEGMTRDQFIFRLMDQVVVKGKNEPITIYQPMCEKCSVDAPKYIAFIERFSNATSDYQAGRFEAALSQFESLRMMLGFEDRPSAVFVKRCKDLISHHPDHWDGIYVAREK